MSEESFGGKVHELYKALCQKEWNAYVVGILVAFFSVLMLAWMRPWGAVGAIRNWGEWIIYGASNAGLGLEWYEDAPKGILLNSGSIIGIGFVAGAFLSATLGNQFAIYDSISESICILKILKNTINCA